MKIVIILLSLLLIGGCSSDEVEEESPYPKSFTVEYESNYINSGPNKNLKITYVVEDGKIVSCEGTYTVTETNGDVTNESCEVEKLLNKDYKGAEILLREITSEEDYEEFTYVRRSSYGWKVIE